MSNKYWVDSLESLFSEHGIAPTKELIDGVISIREMESEACGYLCIPSPFETENETLKKELRKEREKVFCTACNGMGSITENFGFRSATSQCHKCKGTGKI